MTVSLPDHKLTYFPVPKVACTSIKQMFYHLDKGRAFVPPSEGGDGGNIHHVYPTRPFKELHLNRYADHIRLTVIRDPLQRFLSCYSNRVKHHWELSEKHISPEMQAEGATPNPSLDEFIAKLPLYRRASASIRHHSDPLVRFLGRDPSYFNGVYTIKQIPEFTKRVQEITGTDLVPGRSQTGGKKLFVEDLRPGQVNKLRKFYEADYDIWGKHL